MRRAGRSRHAGDDGSFGRSAGMAAGRGAALLAVAVVLGLVLLRAGDDPGPVGVTAGRETEPTLPPVTEPRATTTVAPTVPLRAPREVKVVSANGTDVKGVARRVTDQLKAAGYNVLAPTDATKATSSAVYFTPGYDREAAAVAAALGLPATAVAALPTPSPVADPRGAAVVVVVGPELAQRVAATPTPTTVAPARPTSTTAPATTTTRRP